MPTIPTKSTLAVTLLLGLLPACGDDASSDTGGGGGTGASTTTAATTSSSSASTDSAASTSSSGGGDQGGGGVGGGGDGGGGPTGGGGAGGEAPACTTEAPPEAPCGEDDVGQTCQVDVEGGGCPDTTIVWRCTAVDGAPVWYRSVDTHCFCSVEDDEEACTALPGCVWASPPDETCAEGLDTFPIEETGCYRQLCGTPGFSYFGVVGDACQRDLCEAFPPD